MTQLLKKLFKEVVFGLDDIAQKIMDSTEILVATTIKALVVLIHLVSLVGMILCVYMFFQYLPTDWGRSVVSVIGLICFTYTCTKC